MIMYAERSLVLSGDRTPVLVTLIKTLRRLSLYHRTTVPTCFIYRDVYLTTVAVEVVDNSNYIHNLWFIVNGYRGIAR